MIKKIIIILFLISFIHNGYAITKKTQKEYVNWLNTKCQNNYNIYQAEKRGIGVLVCSVKNWNKVSNDYKKLIIWAILWEWSTYEGSRGVIFKDYYSEKTLFKKHWKNNRKIRRQDNGYF